MPVRPRSMRRLLPVAVVMVGGLVLWAMLRSGESVDESLNFVPVTRGSIEETVTAQGKLEPKEYVDVGAQVSGQLQKIHVEIGDVVTQGQLLAEIDPKIYTAKVLADEAALKTLRAELAEQQAQIAFTRQVFTRNQTLIAADAISKEALEQSETDFKAAEARANSIKAQIEQAESTLAGDKANLSYTKIYAPIAGTVVSQTAREGQTLNANQTAPVLLQVANLDTMTVRAQVAEADVMRLKPGMDVYFTTLGSDRRWQGNVRQILPSPDASVMDVILYNALVDVENTDRQLLTGMSTQMFFVLGNAENVPLIPVRALGKRLPEQDNEQGEMVEVRVKQDKGTAVRQIRIGFLNRNVAEVREGLTENDEVAVNDPKPSESSPRRGPRI